MPDSREPVGQPAFATTRWSVVLAAGQEDPGAREALSVLCESYWYPLYAYLRRTGADAHEAQDLTQGFFADFLGRGDVATADPERGRFRSFLLTSLKNFVSNERARARALKRGGANATLSLDFEFAEGRFALEPGDEDTPEKHYQAAWARELLDRVMNRLRQEYEARGEAEKFDAMESRLVDADDSPRVELARRMGMTAGALKVAIHRMRKRFRAELRAEIASTLADPGDTEDELRALFDALRR